jgi:GSH-dependent disulfide-bond oxidoreductase
MSSKTTTSKAARESAYQPPRVWTEDAVNSGRFSGINRPKAGATHDKALPVGKHALQLYSLATPNGVKVTVMLEELLSLGHAGAEYDAWPIKIMDGDQFSSGFVAVNPNSKIPALLDRSGPEAVRVFESGAIVLYLAEKFQAFLPAGGAARAETLSWLFWNMGSAPFLGGGFGTSVWPTTSTWWVTTTLWPTLPTGPGTEPWCWVGSTRLLNFWTLKVTRMCSAGRS